jgi:hypothetical protein
MKKLALLGLAVIIATSMFGQMKVQPSKTVVIFLGPKNPTFDETKFPDIKFYYTPDLALKDNGGIYGKKSKSKNKNAWSSALGMGATSHSEAVNEFTGAPEALTLAGIGSGYSFIFDKNGVIKAKAIGRTIDYNKNTKFMVSFNKMKRSWESETLDAIMKDLVKKGNTTKPGKASKKPEHKFAIGYGINSAVVEDKDGNKTDITDLAKGDPATMITFLYLSPEYDLTKGKESGKGKKGKDYSNEVAQVIAAEKQLKPLVFIEDGIYGNKVEM